MTVRLVSYTKSVLPDVNTPVELIAYCARVSNPSNQMNHATATKLIKYLVNRKEWSPLTMVDITVEVETTRDIGRQILRHWSFDFQEFSQRYAEVAPDFVFRECRLQDNKNRQNSIELTVSMDDQYKAAWWKAAQDDVAKLSSTIYQHALKMGIAKEVARVILPEGMTPTYLYMKASVRDWVHYLNLRLGNETQKEHRILAGEMKTVIATIIPEIFNIMEN